MLMASLIAGGGKEEEEVVQEKMILSLRGSRKSKRGGGEGRCDEVDLQLINDKRIRLLLLLILT